MLLVRNSPAKVSQTSVSSFTASVVTRKVGVVTKLRIPVAGQERVCPTTGRKTIVVRVREVGEDLWWACEQFGCATIVYDGETEHADRNWHSYQGECMVAGKSTNAARAIAAFG